MGTSKELLYYVKPTRLYATLPHAGVNDLRNNESQGSVKNLPENLKQIGLKCKSAGVTTILISRIVVNNKMTSAYISRANKSISNICRDLTATKFPHQVSLVVVYTYLKSESVYYPIIL